MEVLFCHCLLHCLLLLFVHNTSKNFIFLIQTSTVNATGVDVEGLRASVGVYLADVRRIVAGGTAPIASPPTEEQME